MRKDTLRQKLFLLGLCFPALLAAQPAPMTMQEAVQRAIDGNPEVQARWHSFLATQHEQDAARGAFLPRVDLTLGQAKRYRDEAGIENLSFSQQSTGLSLSQMLFDGFGTRNEVARLGHALLARYFDVLDSAENTALEAVRSYIDVLRYRDLVNLAKVNYVHHRYFFDQIQQRTNAGVGRRVDLEQASGRLALAESNLLIEMNNLHDVSARFQRVVGVLPGVQMTQEVMIKGNVPADINTALKRAYQSNPALFSAIENMRAAKSEIEVLKSRYAPRVDLRANTDKRNTNEVGIGPHATSRTLEVVMSVNLYKGGADHAAIKQVIAQENSNQDFRDKTCMDLRQTLTIAYNDIQRLGEQIKYLDQHQLSIEKAREAYQQQFEIGQRAVLDLLNTESEYFDARRAYVNALRDHDFAYARTYAGMGNLLTSLHVMRRDLPALADLSAQQSDGATSVKCSVEAPTLIKVDKEKLMSSFEPLLKSLKGNVVSRELAKAAASPIAIDDQDNRAASSNAPVSVSPLLLGNLTTRDPSVTEQATDNALRHTLEAVVNDWVGAWAEQHLPYYFSFYATSFSPSNGLSVEAWKKHRKKMIEGREGIAIKISDFKVVRANQDNAVVEFIQTYTSQAYHDVVLKTLKMVLVNHRWLIQRETAVKR